MAKDWTFIRIERFAQQELLRMQLRFLNGEPGRKSKLEKDDRGRFSLTKVILLLVKEIDDKDRRAKKHQARKRGGKASNGDTPTA